MSSSINDVYEAIWQGQRDVALQLLEDYNLISHINEPIGKDNGEKQWHGNYTCLHLACESDDEELVRLLLDMSADVKRTDSRGRTPLHCAATYCRPGIVGILLDRSAESGATDIYGKTALHYLCDNKYPEDSSKKRKDQLDTANLLLGNSPDLWHIQTKKELWEGQTALHLAAKRGNPHIVRLLLEVGAEPDKQEVKGRTALHCLCELDEPQTPEARAAHIEVASLLMKKHSKLWMVQTFFKRQTALHLAARHGRHNIVKLLLTMGAVPMNKDENGCTPLHLMCSEKNPSNTYYSLQVARLLLERSSKNLMTARDGIRGYTALHYAACNGRLDIVKLLVQFDADITITDGADKTAADWAGEEGHTAIVQYLQERKAVSNQMSLVTVPLVDQDVHIGDTAEFVIYLSSQYTKVHWFKDNVPLVPNIKCQIKSHGKSRRVVIDDVTIADEGTYRCEVPGEGNIWAAKLNLLGLKEFIHGFDDTKHIWSEPQKEQLVESSCIRLLLLGEQLVGKTSLARSIMSAKQYLTDKHERTVVMESRNWTPAYDKSFNIVDLGGHPSYQATGHFFYCDASNNCSLLCHDICSDDYSKSFEWVKAAMTRSPMCHILSVLTKADTVRSPDTPQGKKEQFIKSFSQLIEQEIKQLNETVELAEARNSEKKNHFKLHLVRYNELLENLHSRTVVTSCKVGERNSIVQLLQMIMKISSLEQNKISMPQQFQKFYLQIGKIGLRKEPTKSREQLYDPQPTTTRKKQPEMKTNWLKGKVSDVKRSFSINEKYKTRRRSSVMSTYKRYVSFEEAKEIYRQTVGDAGIKEETHLEKIIKQCLQTLHNHGLIIWFNGTPSLDHYIFNDIATFVDILKATFRHDFTEILHYGQLPARLKLLFNNEMGFSRCIQALHRGFMAKPLLQALLHKGDSIEDAEFVFDLLEMLGVGYRYYPEYQQLTGLHAQPECDQVLFIPWFIDNRPEPECLPDLHKEATSFSKTSISLQCKLIGNIPKTYFYYLCVRFSKLLIVDPGREEQTIWRDGFYTRRGKILLLLYNHKDGYIELNVKCDIEKNRSDRLQEAWQYIRYIFDESESLEQQWWPGLVKEMILLCTHCRMAGFPEPCKYDLSHRFYLAECGEHPETQKCIGSGAEIPTALIQPLPLDNTEQVWNSLLEYITRLHDDSGYIGEHVLQTLDQTKTQHESEEGLQDDSGYINNGYIGHHVLPSPDHRKSDWMEIKGDIQYMAVTGSSYEETNNEESISSQSSTAKIDNEVLANVLTDALTDVLQEAIVESVDAEYTSLGYTNHLLNKLQDELKDKLEPDSDLLDKLLATGLITKDDKVLIDKEATITGKNEFILHLIDRSDGSNDENKNDRIYIFANVLLQCGNVKNNTLSAVLMSELYPVDATKM